MIETGDRDLASTRDQQIMALAGALGALGVAAVLLTPAPRRRDDEIAAPAEATDAVADGLSLAPPPAPAVPIVTAAPWAAELAAAAQPVPVAPSPAPAPVRIDLSPLAAACDALARLADGGTLPAVLDTVRPALGARGIAVWLADAGRTTLQVVASSGYDRRVIERFPIVGVTDDNPTAKAFTSVRAIAMLARAGQPAAIAVPIAGPRGTTGVLSMEMAGTREASADVLAAAGIVASQLATLLEPLPAADELSADLPPARVELG